MVKYHYDLLRMRLLTIIFHHNLNNLSLFEAKTSCFNKVKSCKFAATTCQQDHHQDSERYGTLQIQECVAWDYLLHSRRAGETRSLAQGIGNKAIEFDFHCRKPVSAFFRGEIIVYPTVESNKRCWGFIMLTTEAMIKRWQSQWYRSLLS